MQDAFVKFMSDPVHVTEVMVALFAIMILCFWLAGKLEEREARTPTTDGGTHPNR